MIKHLVAYGLTVIFIIFSSNIVNAQVSEIDTLLIPKFQMVLNESGSGCKAPAMGRAFTAIANDPTAVEWNPAGLVQSERSSAFISGRFTFGTLSAKTPHNFGDTHSVTGTDRAEFHLNYVGFAIPFEASRSTIVGGIAVRSMSDFTGNVKWTVLDKKSENSFEYGTETSGGLYAMCPAIGIRVMPQLSVGMSINFITGRQKQRNYVNELSATTPSTVWNENKNKFSGTSIEFGALWQVLPNFSLGAKLSFPYTLNITKIELEYPDEKMEAFDGTVSLKFPSQFALGMAFQPIEDFFFSIDYRFKPLAKVNLTILESEQDRIFDNVNSFHTGIEYIIKTRDSLLPLRMGFYINPTQLFEYDESKPNIKGDRIISNVLTTGMAVVMSGFSFELACDYHLLQYNTVLPFYTTQPMEIKHSRYRFTISTLVEL